MFSVFKLMFRDIKSCKVQQISQMFGVISLASVYKINVCFAMKLDVLILPFDV